MRVLTTERLRLVPVTSHNAEALWELLQQPGLREYQDLPDVDLAQFKRMVGARPPKLEPGSWGRFEWLIYLEGVSEPVGWSSLRVGERVTSSAEIGYSVAQAYRGRGIATESVAALVGEAFARLHLRKVRAYCVPENTPSRAVLINVGFEEDGVLPHGATVGGEPVDVLGYVLDREQWELRKPA
ncbi:MAG TPA: GNAT family N-acetyltransferase [Candidatus Aquilonibacter sp.]